jgi:hypothetical protein
VDRQLHEFVQLVEKGDRGDGRAQHAGSSPPTRKCGWDTSTWLSFCAEGASPNRTGPRAGGKERPRRGA